MSQGCEAVSAQRIYSQSSKEHEDNTSVLARALAKNGDKLSSNNQSRLRFYSTYLTANGSGLLGGDVTVTTQKKGSPAKV